MVRYSLGVLFRTNYESYCHCRKASWFIFVFYFLGCWDSAFPIIFTPCLMVVVFPEANKSPFERDLDLLVRPLSLGQKTESSTKTSPA